MEIRTALPADLDAVMEVYRAAQDFMIRTGNPTQWGRFYPTRELLRQDIKNGACRVVTQDGAVHGVFVLRLTPEPTYRVIEHGAWPNDEPYVTIHRIASDGALHGVFRAAADYCAALCGHIRVDTHRNNLVMQQKIREYGFMECGVIYVADGTPRIAYQWDRGSAGEPPAENRA